MGPYTWTSHLTDALGVFGLAAFTYTLLLLGGL